MCIITQLTSAKWAGDHPSSQPWVSLPMTNDSNSQTGMISRPTCQNSLARRALYLSGHSHSVIKISLQRKVKPGQTSEASLTYTTAATNKDAWGQLRSDLTQVYPRFKKLRTARVLSGRCTDRNLTTHQISTTAWRSLTIKLRHDRRSNLLLTWKSRKIVISQNYGRAQTHMQMFVARMLGQII